MKENPDKPHAKLVTTGLHEFVATTIETGSYEDVVVTDIGLTLDYYDGPLMYFVEIGGVVSLASWMDCNIKETYYMREAGEYAPPTEVFVLTPWPAYKSLPYEFEDDLTLFESRYRPRNVDGFSRSYEYCINTVLADSWMDGFKRGWIRLWVSSGTVEEPIERIYTIDSTTIPLDLVPKLVEDRL